MTLVADTMGQGGGGGCAPKLTGNEDLLFENDGDKQYFSKEK